MRGKTRIGISAFLSTMLLVTFVATLGVPTVLAPTTATLSAPNIVNPLLAPGDTVTVNILVSNVASLWSVEFKLGFDTNLLTPTGYFFETGTAQFRQTFVADLNDAAGYVHLGATRPDYGGRAVEFLGIGDGVTTSYTLSNGVIQPGGVQPFYRVVNEYLGTAQAVQLVGSTWRDPGPWTGGGGDGKVDRMPIYPSPGSLGVERVYRNGVPLAAAGPDWDNPRWEVDYTTGYVKSNQVAEYASRWPAAGSVMTIDYATGDQVPALASVDTAPSGGTGSLTFATPANVGEEVWAQYRYRTGLTTEFALLVASISFRVEARGVSTLHFQSTSLLDQYVPGNAIAHTAVDGVFDNRLQGKLSVPHMVDTSLVNYGDYFSVYVSVEPWMGRPVEKLWGFQFIMDFDPNIVMAIDYEVLGIFMDPGLSEIGMDYVAVTGQSYYGDPVGMTTNVPVPVVRIGFVVLAEGVTALDLRETALANVDGDSMVHEVDSGSFANTMNISMSVNSMFVESRKWSASMDGNTFALTAQVTNTGLGITMAHAHFVVYDSLGVVVADLTTADYDVMPGTTVRLVAMLNVGPLVKPGSYVVEGSVYYLDYLGNVVEGKKGSPTGARSTMVKTFTLYP